jgi:D-alanyl-D-alanine dipeptidase
LTEKQKKNRNLLRQTMLDAGFLPFEYEWWHFTLENEPYPDVYFDFEIR